MQQLQALDVQRPVYIEGESPKIGRLALPLLLVQHMRQSPVLEIHATPQARLDYLLRDYAYLGDHVEKLCERLGYLKEIQGNETIGRWQGWAQAGNLPALFEELMRLNYDPQYQRSQSNHFTQWTTRSAQVVEDLSESAVVRIAQHLVAAHGA